MDLYKIHEDLKSEYGKFFSLLLYFDANVSDDSDDKIVSDYLKCNYPESIVAALIQGRKMLEMEPFPHELIDYITNQFPFRDQTRDNKQGYKEWIEWILDNVEQEARKAGKIS